MTEPEIKGTITLADGSTSEFVIYPDYWEQWGEAQRAAGPNR